MDLLCTLKIKIESQNSDYWYIKDLWTYLNKDQDTKPQSGTSSILQSLKWGLNGHGCSLHLQNQEWELKFGSWAYQWPVIKSESRLRYQTSVRNLQCPPKPKWGLKGHVCSLYLINQDTEQKFRSWVYQRPVTISKLRWSCQTPVRNPQHPLNPKMRT